MRTPAEVAASVVLLLSSLAAAAITQTCPSADSGICYSLNIPELTASSGTGDIFFQIVGPSSFSWVALGQGTQMADSNMFVMYSSADGLNVTISPRNASGHVLPQYNAQAAQLTLLEGSGVSNATMTANVRCSNCNSWNGGTMEFTSSTGSWIWAAMTGPALNSDDLNEGIGYHNLHGGFDWDLSTAKGGADVNPFVSSNAASSQTQPATVTSDSSGSDSEPKKIMTAHGVMASLAFVVIFPVGGILIRTARFAALVKTHMAIQMLGYVIYIAAFGMGSWMASTMGYNKNKHAVIGYVVFVLILFQPMIGWMHHRVFQKTAHRSIWSFVHLSAGRIAIILGMINGGLGLQLANNAKKGDRVAYGVVTGFFGVAYLLSILYGEHRRSSAKQTRGTSGEYMNGDKAEAHPSATMHEKTVVKTLRIVNR